MYELYGGMVDTHICLTIDDKKITCPRGASILAAARSAGRFPHCAISRA